MGTQQILISDDQEKDFQDNKKEKSDGGFVFMNIEDFSESNSTIKETNPISRIITRSFSRKVSQRKEEESKGGGDFLVVGGDDDGGVGVTEEALKELAAALIGSCTSEKSDIIVNIEQSSSAQQQQQKDMTKSIFHQGSNKFMRGMRRRSSYNSNNQFSSSIIRAWIDPRRILFFFATLSSMGTIILIYFTLSIAKLSGDGSAHAQ